MRFPSVVDIVPEGECGLAKIEHYEVGEPSQRWLLHPQEYVAPGWYCRLLLGGYGIVMSDTQMEQDSNYGVVSHSHGKVLIAGLGIGMILRPILAKADVDSILVVEKSQDVIDLVAEHYADPKLSVVCADIHKWQPAEGERFNTIYFDIWGDICVDHLKEIGRLHRRGRRWLDCTDPEAWIASWQANHLRRLRRCGRWR